MAITDAEFIAAHPELADLAPETRAPLLEMANKASDFEATQATNAELQRKVAFADAKLPDSPVADLFRDNYKGELTNEAILAEAAKYGLTPVAAAPANAASLEAARRINGATAGSPEGIDPTSAFERKLFNAPTAEVFDAMLADAPAELNVRLAGTVGGYRII